MKVSSLSVDPFTRMPMVVLKDHGGRQMLPIFIGMSEASAIAAELEGIHLDRPMTHDLMVSILDRAELLIEAVEIHDLKGTTFFAVLHILRPDGERMVVDARPSDAIALALRTGTPIQVSRSVLKKARDIEKARPAGPAAFEVEGTGPGTGKGIARDTLADLDDSAFGKWKM